jgi:hypothetical protein
MAGPLLDCVAAFPGAKRVTGTCHESAVEAACASVMRKFSGGSKDLALYSAQWTRHSCDSLT